MKKIILAASLLLGLGQLPVAAEIMEISVTGLTKNGYDGDRFYSNVHINEGHLTWNKKTQQVTGVIDISGTQDYSPRKTRWKFYPALSGKFSIRCTEFEVLPSLVRPEFDYMIIPKTIHYTYEYTSIDGESVSHTISGIDDSHTKWWVLDDGNLSGSLGFGMEWDDLKWEGKYIRDITLERHISFRIKTTANSVAATTPIHVRVEGDANEDGLVNFDDFVLLATHYGQTVVATQSGDLDGNGRVDFRDFIILSRGLQ